MLYSVESGNFVMNLPHSKNFCQWRKNLSDADYQKILDNLNGRIDSDEIHTAGWMPGSDWTGTVFEPIYHACGHNLEAAGLFFGLIVFKVMMERDDCWGFGKYEKNGVPIRSMTYFKITKPE